MKKTAGKHSSLFFIKGMNGALAKKGKTAPSLKRENGALAKRGEWRPAPACYSLPTFFSTGRQISI